MTGQSSNPGSGLGSGHPSQATPIEAGLVLFMTRGVSLASWKQVGTLSRETAIYRALNQSLGWVGVASYGGRSDKSLGVDLGLKVFCNSLGLPQTIYAQTLALGWGIKLESPAAFKSNQVPGAEIALAAARAKRAPFIARAGYLPSNIMAWRHGADSVQAHEMGALEEKVFTGADMCVVTTGEMADKLISRYRVPPGNIRIIPNFVDTNRFRPLALQREPCRLLYVGRLHQEKNLSTLVQACTGMDLELCFIGEGPLRLELGALAAGLGVDVRFLGRVENRDLPKHIARAALFVLPSKGEHHPKALLEAMSCAAPVLGSDVPGIRELITSGRTGLLAGTSSKELRGAINSALSDPQAMASMGAGARDMVKARFGFSQVLRLELAMLEEVLG